VFCVNLPPDASTVAAVSSALVYLDSRAMAAFMKELAGLLSRWHVPWSF